jgi:excinuclease ABC subunit C
MKDGKGVVIYVGKAVVLRNRVRSYFHASAQHTPKTLALVNEIQDIAWWVTQTELEALILENELIKQHRPRYNVRLKDDKSFPYIKVGWQADFPKVGVVRKILRDGARYFGPYTSGRASYTTLEALRRIFPYLDCDRVIDGRDERPCLYYHIKLCGGPCIGAQNKEDYRGVIQQLMDFLSGDADRVLGQLQRQMERAAENLQFELAVIYRDRLKAAQVVAKQQKIVSTVAEDLDYIAFASDERTGDTAVQLFMVRHGRLIGREHFILEGALLADYVLQNPSDALQNTSGSTTANEPDTTAPADSTRLTPGMLVGVFIQQFYDNASLIPKMIAVQAMPENSAVLESWLNGKAGHKVTLRLPQRGPKLELMQLALKNAAEFLRLQQAEWVADTNRQTNAVYELQEALSLPNPPLRIECYDISTLQGTNTVGAMVVFAKGAPLKGAYRRFKITGKGGQGAPDDFASMREMLRRRFKRLVEVTGGSLNNGANGDGLTATISENGAGKESAPEHSAGERGARPANDTNEALPEPATKQDEQWRILPDLIIIDGGKGQLGVAVEVLEEYGLLDRIAIVGLAKREEEIFLPHQAAPLWLKRGGQALHLVQRIRDEAHRFGITFHRKLRSKSQVRSKLDDVPGIGPTRRKALLTFFAGDIERIRRATLEELMAAPGINRKAAEAIKSYLA